MRLVQQIRSGPEGGRYRLLAGSSADPAREINEGRLLEEFHCALSTLAISLPPLRERGDDQKIHFLRGRQL